MTEKVPGSGGEELGQEEQQESFEDYQKRMAKEAEEKLVAEVPEKAAVENVSDAAKSTVSVERMSLEDTQKRVQELNKDQPSANNPEDPEELDEDYIAGLLAQAEERQAANTVPEEIRKGGEEEKNKLEELFDQFEQKHSLEDLNAIQDVSPELSWLFLHTMDLTTHSKLEELERKLAELSPEEQEKYKLRESARNEVAQMKDTIKTIEQKKSLLPEDLAVLKARCKTYSMAFGILNNNKIDHTRG